MDIERGNTKHGPAHDEELAHELEDAIRGNPSSRIEEWRDPESPADDNPETGIRPDTESR
ncbi:hypothetical protein [Nocardia fluminea]|uniref:hypothetical protein n=1 Tax=Nocardia fluminea TaxID=134984 RepID=UPI0033F4FC63